MRVAISFHKLKYPYILSDLKNECKQFLLLDIVQNMWLAVSLTAVDILSSTVIHVIYKKNSLIVIAV